MSLTPEETGAKIIADVTKILNGNNPTERPAYFDVAHNALSMRADDLLQDEWTEEDTVQFLMDVDDFTTYNYATETADFEEALFESADDYVLSKTAFPENLDLQRQVAQSDITKSELRLFVVLEEGLNGVVDSDEKLDYFVGTIRNGSPSVYAGDIRMGRVSETVQDFAESLIRSDVQRLMQNSSFENTFAERMAAAEVLRDIHAYGAAYDVALNGSDDLVNAINNGEVVPTLTDLGYNSHELSEAIEKISSISGSQVILSSLESGLIDSRETLDGLLTSKGVKPPTVRV